MAQFNRRYTRVRVIPVAILVFVVATMTYFSNILAKRLAEDEQNKMRVWAEAYRVLGSESANDEANSMAMEIITNNETIPLLISDANGNITSRNIKLPKQHQEEFLQKKLEEYKSKQEHEPIEISFEAGGNVYTNYIYYGRSNLLRRLAYFPIWQVAIITFFMIVAYYYLNVTKRSEENRVWVGLSKETAHQLGTPISSLLAWIDLMKSGHQSDDMADEMQKDITRLEVVANRFSKIGSQPTLEMYNLSEVLDDSITYMSTRISKKVSLKKSYDREQFIPVMMRTQLFDWVIENLIKNAVDSMRGGGNIIVELNEEDKNAIIDITDDGKGIPKKNQRDIFRPGYSSKERGWGLGLSFARRIISNYHDGKIFVHRSEVNVGTTFRIILPKCSGEECE